MKNGPHSAELNTAGAAPRWRSRIAMALIFSALVLGLVVARTLERGRLEMAKSDSAFDNGKLGASLRAARRAATWYIPGAPHVVAAEARMRAIALGAEAAGRSEMARLAWHALRGALIETQHPGGGRQDRRQEADAQLSRLMGRAAQREGHTDMTSDWVASRLTGAQISPFWSGGVGISFVLMLVAGALILDERRRRVGNGLWALHVAVGGLGLFVWVCAAIQS